MLNGTKVLDLEVKEGGMATTAASPPSQENPGGGGGGTGGGACCCIGCIGNISCTNENEKQ